MLEIHIFAHSLLNYGYKILERTICVHKMLNCCQKMVKIPLCMHRILKCRKILEITGCVQKKGKKSILWPGNNNLWPLQSKLLPQNPGNKYLFAHYFKMWPQNSNLYQRNEFEEKLCLFSYVFIYFFCHVQGSVLV